MAIIEIDKDPKDPDYVPPIKELPEDFKNMAQSNATYLAWYNRIQATRKSISTISNLGNAGGSTYNDVPDELVAQVVGTLTYPLVSSFKNVDGSVMIPSNIWNEIITETITAVKSGKNNDEKTQKKLYNYLGEAALGIGITNLVMVIMDKLGQYLLLADEIIALCASITAFVSGVPVKYTSLIAAVESAAVAIPVTTSGGGGTANAQIFNLKLQTLQTADRTATPENLKSMIVELGEKLLQMIQILVETNGGDTIESYIGAPLDAFNTIVPAFDKCYTALKAITGI